MQSLNNRITAANRLLESYAVPIEGTLGREYSDTTDETRFPFQRDRDRIIHSLAFRRLKGKTQVFVAGGGDHYRTRLTHTMEVAQISRDMARTLGLNEDLAECIGLAHDLGHPPFGHAGEESLDTWMRTFGKGFEHNAQSLRIVTLLETHSSLHTGLNLNKEVLEGLMKHRTPHDKPAADIPRSPTLEAQIVNIADEIAYTGHDCDDGLRAGLFTLDALQATALCRRADAVRSARGTSLRGAIIHLLVTDLYEETETRIARFGIQTLNDVYAAQTSLVDFSETIRLELTELRGFLWKHMYLHPAVRSKAADGQDIVMRLCKKLHAGKHPKITALQEAFDATKEEAVKDYVAGMTDAFATESAAH